MNVTIKEQCITEVESLSEKYAANLLMIAKRLTDKGAREIKMPADRQAQIDEIRRETQSFLDLEFKGRKETGAAFDAEHSAVKLCAILIKFLSQYQPVPRKAD
jgi:hypothetical protein